MKDHIQETSPISQAANTTLQNEKICVPEHLSELYESASSELDAAEKKNIQSPYAVP